VAIPSLVEIRARSFRGLADASRVVAEVLLAPHGYLYNKVMSEEREHREHFFSRDIDKDIYRWVAFQREKYNQPRFTVNLGVGATGRQYYFASAVFPIWANTRFERARARKKIRRAFAGGIVYGGFETRLGSLMTRDEKTFEREDSRYIKSDCWWNYSREPGGKPTIVDALVDACERFLSHSDPWFETWAAELRQLLAEGY